MNMLPKPFLRRMIIAFLEKGVNEDDYILINNICDKNDWNDIIFQVSVDTDFDYKRFSLGYTEAKFLLSKKIDAD